MPPLTDYEFNELLKEFPPEKQAILRKWRDDDVRGAAEIRRKQAIAQATIDFALASMRSRI